MDGTLKDVSQQPRSSMVRATRSDPCPVCERDDWCLVAPDKTAAICMRHGDGSAREIQFKDGQIGYLHRLFDSTVVSTYVHPSHAEKPKPAIDWAKRVADAFDSADADRARLAELLGVTTESLTALGVGFDRDCWTFPERDAKGKPIGISRRLVTPTRDGKTKLAARGSARGLTYAVGGHNALGPILLVEGGSDTAAILSIGLCVIGRPSNTGGVPLLVELLAKHPDRAVIVIGERDRKPDGRWPGRAGAISTAQRLAEGLDRPIYWALPPGGAKDSRAFLNLLMPEISAKRLADLGKLFLDSLETTAIEPPELPKVEPYREPAGELVELDIWRRDMGTARLETIDKPGLYFDGSPTGAGKSFADRDALRLAGKSLTLLPTHSNCRELAAELCADGIDAVAYPKLNEDTCKNLDEATSALQIGLSPAAAVCPNCPYRNGCQYMARKISASKADHAIATHARAARGFVRLATGKRFVSVHENAENMLRPSVVFERKHLVESGEPGAIQQVAYEAKEIEQAKQKPDFELVVFFDAIRDAADELIKQIDNTTETTSIEIASTMPAPKRWEQKLWRAFHWRIQTSDSTKTIRLNGDALRAVVGVVTGELHHLAVCVDTLREKRGGATRTHKTFLAIWQTELPTDTPIWCADATGRAELLEQLTGKHVIDRTPPGRLEQPTRAVQLPRDITRKTAPKTVAAWLRGILAAHPEAKRVGLIGHRPHIKKLLGKRSAELLDESTRRRICRHAYFGEGIDRGSNGWMGCDLLVILGTPRIGDMGIRQRLIRAGQIEAAARDGDWGDRAWAGRTESGQAVTIEGRGYRDPDWAMAARDEVIAGLIQAAGRGRPVLETGVPVIVASTESLGLPIADSAEIRQISQAVVVVRETLNKIIKENPNNEIATTTAIAGKLGKSVSRTSELLTEAADAGLVERLPGRKAGWTVPEEETVEQTDGFIKEATEPVPVAIPAEPPRVSHDVTPSSTPTWPPPDWTLEDIVEWDAEREAIAWEGQPTPISEIMPVVLAGYDLAMVPG